MAIVRRKNDRRTELPIHKTPDSVLEDAAQFGLTLVPFDIKGLLAKYNIALMYEDMDDISGYVELRQGVWVISINKYQSSRRQRFTMAHELAHIFLHRDTVSMKKYDDTIFFRSSLTNTMEKDANDFASDILIPQKILFDILRKEKRVKLSELADIFQVSLDAMRYKAFRLRLIQEY